MGLTVEMIESQKEKNLPGKGDFISYKLTVKEGEVVSQNVELFQKKDSVPPKVGETYDYWKLEDGQYGKKIKKEPRVPGGGGGFRPRDPKETAAIQRQHSQSVAVEYLKAKIAAGSLKNFPEVDDLRALIDWFQRDIDHGVNLAMYGSKKEEQRKEPTRTGASDVPAKPEEFVHLPDDGKGTPFEV